MIKKICHSISIIVCIAMTLTTHAQHLTAYHNTVSNGYNFWLYTPADYDSTATHTDKKPLILFLHGGSLCGSNMNSVLRYGTLDALRRGRQIDAIVMAPQCPGRGWNAEQLMHTVDWVVQHYRVDTNRFYVLGMSMGGIGTINFVGTYPQRVAAAMAICGAGRLKDYSGLNSVPFWIFHGTADKVIPLSESQRVVRAMVSAGDTSRLLFTTLPGMGHSQPCQLFYMEDTYRWLLSHSLSDTNRRVNRDYVLNKAALSKAYTNLHQVNIPISHVNAGKNVSSSASTTTAAASSNSQTSYYTIRKGDTLGAIAQRNHTTVKKLCQLNHLTPTTVLQIGKRIRIR